MLPEEYYNNRITELESILSKLLGKKSQLGWGRFLVMLVIAGVIYFLMPYGWLYVIAGSLLLLSIFIKLVFTDIDNNKAIQHTQQLIKINKDEIKAINGDYLHFEDGSVYIPHDHLYSNDLDIFGKASLYQYLNRTTSAIGGAAVANWLLNPAKEETIMERQTAIKELHSKTEWRQSLHAFGKERKIEQSTYLRLQEWIEEEYSFINHPFWMVLQLLVPAIMIIVVILNATDLLSDAARNLFLIASAIAAFFISKKVVPLHDKVSKLTEELDVLSDSIRLIENTNFTSPLLVQLQSFYKQKDSNA
jgi:hypothetical protein